jgi:hypothetical protein
MLGIVFALVVVAAGLSLARVFPKAQWELAPALGLGLLPVMAVWCSVAHAPPWLAGVLIVALAAFTRIPRELSRTTASLLVVSTMLPAVLLAISFAGVEVPVSNHDGAFHVETIDALRRGEYVATWYPIGFHAAVATILALAPWLDTARGTVEATQGLAMLTPLCVFGLGRAFGLRPVEAATAAVIQALTFVFPYDYHLWGGWPLGMSVLLALGIWSIALRWTAQPDLRWAVYGALLATAIVLTHGTEVYTSLLGLIVIGGLGAGRVRVRKLAPHLAVAIGLALVLSSPYLPTLLGWARGGGATPVGLANLDFALAHPDVQGRADWLQFALGMTGAGSATDLPIRVVLLAVGLRQGVPRALVGLWLTFAALLFMVDFLDIPFLNQVYVLTFPWLVDHRPRQVAVVLASLIEAMSLIAGVRLVQAWRPRLAARPQTWRRAVLAGALVVGFVAEGSAVSIYKRLARDVADQTVYSADDGAAMAWLRLHAQPGDMLANNEAVDAGIWAPYKANLPILLPRSVTAELREARQPIVDHVLDLTAVPSAEAQACALGVNYLYQGARDAPHTERALPARTELAHAADLREVFRSGQAVVFRIQLPCRVP